jgi:hypothetical protein
MVNFSIGSHHSASKQRPYVGKMPVDRGGRHHCGRHQMSTRARALPAAEIAVGRRGTALAWCDQITVDADTQRAPGLSPFQSSIAEDAIKALLLGLPFY